jgi:multiple sugar transport system substrate-binding protein
MIMQYSDKTKPYFDDLIKAFNQVYPNIKVNLEVVNWQNGHDVIAQRVAANKLPDLVNIATIWLPEYVKAGFAEPLDARLTPDFKSQFYENLLVQGAQYQGKAYGLPIAVSARALYYNKDIFKAAGLDPEKAPKTWDDLKADAAQIKAKTGKFGFGIDGKSIETFRYFTYFLWNNGGDLLKDGKAAFNSPQGVEALQFLADMYKAGLTPDPATIDRDANLQPLFWSGDEAMAITGPWFINMTKEKAPNLNLGVAKLPVKSGDPTTLAVTDTLMMNSKGNKDMAWKFVQFMYQPSWRLKFDQAEGMLPEMKAVGADPFYQGNPQLKSVLELLPSGRFDPLDDRFNKLQDELRNQIQLVYRGDATAQDALNSAAKTFDTAEN